MRTTADFCGWELSTKKLDRVRQRSSFEFTKRYEQQFDPALETLWEQGVRLKSFLRNGRVGDGATMLSEQQTARFEKARKDQLVKVGISLP